MEWLKRFMAGRYGSDQLSVALIIVSLLFTLAANAVNLPLLAYIGYVPLVFCIFRILSRNTAKRSMENYKFSMLISPVYSWFKRKQHQALESKTYRFFKCPGCKSKLRLPKGKGKILITCPVCGEKFTKTA